MSPSPRNWRLFAEDILEACGKIRRYVGGRSLEAFASDDLVRDAVIRNIEIIGEAAKNLPEDVLARAPEVEWRKIRGMRDVIVHGYFGLDDSVLWTSATTRIDELEAAVRRLLA